jgi:DNA end-binding protein Ku
MRGQEYVVALKPCGRGMLLETLRYADEVNKANSYFRDIGDAKPDEDLLDMATSLIERKTGKFDASEFHNRYVDALKDLIAEKRKKKGELVIQDPEKGQPKGSNVIDLMAALKKSLRKDAEEEEAPRKKPGIKRGSAKPAPRRAAAKKAPAKKAAPKRAAGGRRR